MRRGLKERPEEKVETVTPPYHETIENIRITCEVRLFPYAFVTSFIMAKKKDVDEMERLTNEKKETVTLTTGKCIDPLV